MVITRIRRQGLEITPTGTATLEIGDSIRWWANRLRSMNLSRMVAGKPARADETQMVTFLVGLVLGVLLGNISDAAAQWPGFAAGKCGRRFPGGLVIGHFGRVGNLRVCGCRLRPATSPANLGLMLFLAGAGTNAGAHLVEVVQQRWLESGGWRVLVISAVTVLTGLGLMMPVYKHDFALHAGRTVRLL